MSIQARSLSTAVRRRLAPTVAEAGPGVDLDAVVGAATDVAALSAGDAPGVGALDTVADWLGEGEDEVGVDPVMVPDAGRAAEGVDAAVAEEATGMRVGRRDSVRVGGAAPSSALPTRT